MYEPWLMFRKPLDGRTQDNLRKWKTGGLRRISDDQPFGDVIRSHPTRKEERAIAPHPSLKPQAFLRQIVRAILPLGAGVILDPFAGSGSTLAAAAALGYRAIGIESDTRYVRVAKRGIPKLAALNIPGLHRNADRDRLALSNDDYPAVCKQRSPLVSSRGSSRRTSPFVRHHPHQQCSSHTSSQSFSETLRLLAR